MKQNFFDQLDGGWGDLIADTYKDANEYYKLMIGYKYPMSFISDEGEVIKNVTGIDLFFEIEDSIAFLNQSTVSVDIKAKIIKYKVYDGTNEYTYLFKKEDNKFEVTYSYSDIFYSDIGIFSLDIDKNFGYDLKSPHSAMINKKLEDFIINKLHIENDNKDKVTHKLITNATFDIRKLVSDED